ncbi:PIR protein [Plasmodium vivax]|uniref:VIR protein n=1 Tax=Plasmodium vivax TaxID=5855 RepID=A0A565A5L3_PLAVI|nr:PIR protein [Plasmodium vivax]
MADDYEYEHVKTFPTYASKLDELEHFSDIKYNTNDPIAKRCTTNADSFGGFFFIDLCITLNKYFQYYDHLKPVDSKHCEYLSYWLNKKSKLHNAFPLYKKILDGDRSLNIFDETIPNIETYKSKLGNLSNEVVKNINTLNNLNEQYLFLITKHKIGESTHDKLCGYAEKFAEIYNSAIRDCFINFNNKYCKELIEFKVRFNKYKSFTDTCHLVQPLSSIPGANFQELEAIKKYSHIEEHVSTYSTDTLMTALKALGGVAVLLLIIKFAPLKSLLRSRKQKKKRGFYDGADDNEEGEDESYQDEPYGYGSYGDGSYGHGTYGDNSYGYGSYGDVSYMDKSYAGDSFAGDSYAGDSYAGDSYAGDSYAGDSYADDSYRGRSDRDRPYDDESYQDRSSRDRSSRDRSSRDRSSRGRSSRDGSYNNDSYYYEDEDPRQHNREYNLQYYSTGNNYY